MTLEELKTCGKPTILATDIATILGCDAHALRIAAHENPHGLGFPVMVLGTRVSIPRKAFLRWLGEDV